MDTATLRKQSLLETAFKVAVFDADNHGLWAISRNGSLQHWDSRSARLLEKNSLPSKTTPTFAIASTDRQLLLSGDSDGRLHWWSLRDCRLLAETHARRGTVWHAIITPDGRFVITTGGDRRLRLWNCADRSEITFAKLTYDDLQLAVAPDGKRIAAASINRRIEIRSAESLQLERAIATDDAKLSAIPFSSDGRQLWAAGSSGIVSIYSTDDWREIVELTTKQIDAANTGRTNSIVWLGSDEKSSLLAACLDNGHIRLWWR